MYRLRHLDQSIKRQSDNNHIRHPRGNKYVFRYDNISDHEKAYQKERYYGAHSVSWLPSPQYPK